MGGYYGWQTLEFDPERDLAPKGLKAWISDAKDSVPILKPFPLWILVWHARHGQEYGGETLSLPTGKGWDIRTKDGYFYLGLIEPTEEEQKQREPIFRERIIPWIEDFEGIWRGKLIPELMEHYERLKKVDVGKLSNLELLEHFDDWDSILKRSWEIHHQTMWAIYNIYGLFEDMCKELLGIERGDPIFTKLMGGFENKAFEVDRKLWHLSDRARELGLDQLFQTTADDEELLSKLGESEAGRNWLHELHQFLQEYGWRAPRISGIDDPSWVEKPSLALPDIRRDMAKGGAFLLEEERKRLAQEREQAERDVLSRVPEDKREWFEKLMRAAQWCPRFSEDHQFYCESYSVALGRRVTKEMGRRFAQAGVIDDPDDIYFLLPDEIRLAAIPMRYCEMRTVVQIRKEQFEEFAKDVERPTATELFLGDVSYIPEVVVKDPVFRILTPVQVVKPELKADLYGSGSAPGVAEGIARVIFSTEEIPQVQPGEILVTPITSPYWTPLFASVKAVVTDTGGSLAHPVIVGREYGIPVVAGTLEATKKIKTGDRIRVDGDNCCVYILGD